MSTSTGAEPFIFLESQEGQVADPLIEADALDTLLAHTLRKSDVSDYVRLHLKPLV